MRVGDADPAGRPAGRCPAVRPHAVAQAPHPVARGHRLSAGPGPVGALCHALLWQPAGQLGGRQDGGLPPRAVQRPRAPDPALCHALFRAPGPGHALGGCRQHPVPAPVLDRRLGDVPPGKPAGPAGRLSLVLPGRVQREQPADLSLVHGPDPANVRAVHRLRGPPDRLGHRVRPPSALARGPARRADRGRRAGHRRAGLTGQRLDPASRPRSGPTRSRDGLVQAGAVVPPGDERSGRARAGHRRDGHRRR